MDKINAYFAMVGFFTVAYFMGYVVYIVLYPFTWLFDKLGLSILRLHEANARLDQEFNSKV